MKKELSPKQREELLSTLKARFEKNMNRHKGLEWDKVQAKLETNSEKCGRLMKWKERVVNRMLLVMIKKRDEYIFYDCSAESPKGRRSLCYDREALDGKERI